jgi:hypothetical protein
MRAVLGIEITREFGMVEVDRGVLGEDMVMHLEARFAVLQIMRFNEKEHAEQGAMPHE